MSIKLEPMFESMAINQEQKVALQENFDKAVMQKTTEMLESYVEEKVNEKVEVLEEEYKEKISLLEDSLDGYLSTIVEDFYTKNAPSYDSQIAEEKVKTLLEMFDNMVKITGVDMLTIQESKEIKDQDEFESTPLYIAESTVESLNEKLTATVNKLVDAKREADKFLQSGLVNEMKEGLTILEGEKFEKLASLVPFERSSSYMSKLETLKESIVGSRVEDFNSVGEVPLPKNAFKQTSVDSKQAMDFSKYI